QPGSDLPRVLPVDGISELANSVHCIRELEIVVPKTANEIREDVARKCSKRTEIETAIVEKVEVEVVPNSRNIAAELELMPSVRPRDIVCPPESHQLETRGASRRRSEIKIWSQNNWR